MAPAAAIDTSTARFQTSYAKTAVDVPTAGLSRVANGSAIYPGGGPSIAGPRSENNSLNIDGVLNDNHYQTGPQVYLSNGRVSVQPWRRIGY